MSSVGAFGSRTFGSTLNIIFANRVQVSTGDKKTSTLQLKHYLFFGAIAECSV